ncbi:Hypothetical protein, putative [Bodo saltans]|uniref:Uncharacterized protein n=1 Tax=Bodo saltans TaxID=75058 RepID=A0A0S4JB52_BODSA|nr:Hypothetical protein, putative [Bodo saltans]|eukprot:CUG88743.1 Hypothetical protein, putative [Bodo saltans]
MKSSLRPSSSGNVKTRDPYGHLTREELQRIHSSLYGHRSSLREKTIAHAVTLKATGASTTVSAKSRSDHPGSSLSSATLVPKSASVRPAPIMNADYVMKAGPLSAATLAHDRLVASAASSRLCGELHHYSGEPRKPQATVLTRPVWQRLTAPPQTLSAEMQSWAKGMGSDFTFPLKISNVRRDFLRQPLRTSAIEQWKRACAAGDVHVMNSLRACVVHTSAGGDRPRRPPKQRACWCTTTQSNNNTQQSSTDETVNEEAESAGGATASGTKNRTDIINAALAHWKLNRVIEQGSSYLYYVCPGAKNRATALASNLGGLYIIPDGAFVDDAVSQVKVQRSKLRVIQALNAGQLHDDHGVEDHKAGGEDGGEDEDVGDDPDYNKEDGEYLDGRVREPSDLFQFPSIEITLKDNNLLSLKVHMSDAQVRFLLRGAKEEDPGSRSAFAFEAEAVCVGEDCWFMITGMMRKKLVWVLRDAHNPALIDSIVIDGVCWEKRRFDDGAKATDPFQCTQCGNVRRGDNVSYSSRNTNTIRRGKYRCLICGVNTVHVSLRSETFRPRPRWNPTSGHPLAADHCSSCKEVETIGGGKR